MNLIRKLYKRIKTHGFVNTVVLIYTKILALASSDFHYVENDEFILYDELDAINKDSKNSKTANWIIPDIGIGSGGHLNIFRFIQFLERNGYICTIAIVGSHKFDSSEYYQSLIKKNFFALRAKVVFGVEDLPPAKFTFATSWITAYYLRKFQNTSLKLYFLQDFEPDFYPKGSEYDFALKTYSFGYIGVCAGGWLAEKFSSEFGMSCYSYNFSYDKEIYKIKKHITREKITKIFCYFRPQTPRRGSKTTLLALALVAQKYNDVEFVFAGYSGSLKEVFAYKHQNLGVVAINKLPDVYNACDIALCLSFTNLSLLPLELMACGCAVVSNKGSNVEWLLNSQNSVLVDSDPKSIAEGIGSLIEDKNKLKNLVTRAQKFASTTDWNDGFSVVLSQLEKI